MKKIIFALISIAVPMFTLAHPGHGKEDPIGPYHYLVNLEHLIPSVTAIAGVILIGWLVYRLRNKIERS